MNEGQSIRHRYGKYLLEILLALLTIGLIAQSNQQFARILVTILLFLTPVFFLLKHLRSRAKNRSISQPIVIGEAALAPNADVILELPRPWWVKPLGILYFLILAGELVAFSFRALLEELGATPSAYVMPMIGIMVLYIIFFYRAFPYLFKEKYSHSFSRDSVKKILTPLIIFGLFSLCVVLTEYFPVSLKEQPRSAPQSWETPDNIKLLHGLLLPNESELLRLGFTHESGMYNEGVWKNTATGGAAYQKGYKGTSTTSPAAYITFAEGSGDIDIEKGLGKYEERVSSLLANFARRNIDYSLQYFNFNNSEGVVASRLVLSHDYVSTTTEWSLLWNDTGRAMFIGATETDYRKTMTVEKMLELLVTMRRSDGINLLDSASTTYRLTNPPTKERTCTPNQVAQPWEIYTSAKYKFSIQYPKHLCWAPRIKSSDYDIVFGDKESEIGGETYFVSVRSRASFSDSFTPNIAAKKTMININGLPATLFTETKKDTESGADWTKQEILIFVDKYMYDIKNTEVLNDADLPSFKQFYESFKFQ